MPRRLRDIKRHEKIGEDWLKSSCEIQLGKLGIETRAPEGERRNKGGPKTRSFTGRLSITVDYLISRSFHQATNLITDFNRSIRDESLERENRERENASDSDRNEGSRKTRRVGKLSTEEKARKKKVISGTRGVSARGGRGVVWNSP